MENNLCNVDEKVRDELLSRIERINPPPPPSTGERAG